MTTNKDRSGGSWSRGIPASWERYQRERDALLERVVSQLNEDRRVAAAWLFGSLGRGNEDALSDLDVWVVVDDDHIGEFVSAREETAVHAGPLLFTVDAPQNAPRYGAYLMACYDAPTAPHLVDWYWQPRSEASRPAETRLLFDRADLPSSSGVTPGGQGVAAERTELESANQALRFFWAMLMITAKHAARKPDETEIALLPYVFGPLIEVRRFVGDEAAPGEELLHTVQGDRLLILKTLADRMSALLPAATSRGLSVPSGAAAAVRRYIDMAARETPSTTPI